MQNQNEPASIDRRTFLGGVAAGAGAGWLAMLAGCVKEKRRARTKPTPPAGVTSDAPSPVGRILTAPEWRALDAALDVMLPSGPGSPGSRDVNGIGYLDAALADPDTEPAEADHVRQGAAWLDEAARAAGAADFAAATPEAREVAVRAVVSKPGGPEWALFLLMFGLEALLGDPVHGGNTGEVGWTWLAHVPGDPRPAAKAVEGRR